MYMHMQVHAYVHVCLPVCKDICVETTVQPQVFFGTSSTVLFWRQSLSLVWFSPTRLGGLTSEAQGSTFSTPSA